MQRRRRLVEPADRNGEHDAISYAREVAIADEGGAVAQKNSVEERFRREGPRRDGGKRCRNGHRDEHDRSQRIWAPDSHGTISQQHGKSQPSGPPRPRQAAWGQILIFSSFTPVLTPRRQRCGKAVEDQWIGCGTVDAASFFRVEIRCGSPAAPYVGAPSSVLSLVALVTAARMLFAFHRPSFHFRHRHPAAQTT